MPEEVFPWFAPDWTGPTVEQRPPDAADWPPTAVERILFRADDFPELVAAIPDALPYVAYFDADGWPTICPADVRVRLDPRMRVEFHRFPWTMNEANWHAAGWIHFAHSFDRYQMVNYARGWPRGMPRPIPAKRRNQAVA